jgi:hypothetical protein
MSNDGTIALEIAVADKRRNSCQCPAASRRPLALPHQQLYEIAFFTPGHRYTFQAYHDYPGSDTEENKKNVKT